MWERWDGWTPEDGFQNPGMNSFNHYAFGAVGEYLYKTVGGIRTDGPGYKRLVIMPKPGGGLTWAKTSYESIRGTIATDWKVVGDKLTLTVTVPANTTAEVHVPAVSAEGIQLVDGSAHTQYAGANADGGVFEVGSGSYTFESTLPEAMRP